jgi:hypothetical protein
MKALQPVSNQRTRLNHMPTTSVCSPTRKPWTSMRLVTSQNLRQRQQDHPMAQQLAGGVEGGVQGKAEGAHC